MTGAADLRTILEDLLRLGMEDVPGYTNRRVDQIQLEHVTNPYGRQPPHVLVFPDGRAERMTPFQVPVPGYPDNVVAVELLGYQNQSPTPAQFDAVRSLGALVRQSLSGRVAFIGNDELVMAATSGVDEARPVFMTPDALTLAPIVEPVDTTEMFPVHVQDVFDILGTPPERRIPLPPGSIFNSVNNIRSSGAAQAMRQLFKAPGLREISRLVVVASHDSFKAEPADESAYDIDALRRADIRLGMTDFRGHYLIAKDGRLIEGRSLDSTGSCWPGKNEQAIQLVIAGNGRAPTCEQRETLFLYAAAMRRHYECPLFGNVREVVFAEQLLGIDPTGVMKESLANPAMIEADLPKNKAVARRAAL